MNSTLRRRFGVWCGVVALLGFYFSAKADDNTTSKSANPIEADVLMRKMEEISCLQLITPLHLTNMQLTKIEDILDTTIKNYDKEMKAVAEKHFADLVPKIEAAHHAALLGKQPPDDLQKQFEDALNAVLKERDKINKENIASVSNQVRPLLTDDQVRTAIKLARNIPGYQTQSGTDAQWFHLWVATALLDYDRIVPLLKELQKTQAAALQSSPALKGQTSP